MRCLADGLKEKILQATWNLLNGNECDDKLVMLIQQLHSFNTEMKNSNSRRRDQEKLQHD